MEVLERLYDCADTHLDNSGQDWEGFKSDFCGIFESEMVFYRITFDPVSKTPSAFDVIVSSKPEAAKEYVDRKLYALHPVDEESLAPLEPILRSEIMSDDQLKGLDVMSDFVERHGYFYQLIAPAILPDGTFLGLVVWRNESEGDFNAMDKQRIALFMRHLLAKVQLRKLVSMKVDNDVTSYGRQFNLTKTETEILTALLDGHSLRSISDNTSRTYGTIRWHVQNILSKCQVSNQKALLTNFYSLIKA